MNDESGSILDIKKSVSVIGVSHLLVCVCVCVCVIENVSLRSVVIASLGIDRLDNAFNLI